jgi:hypothetical protein
LARKFLHYFRGEQIIAAGADLGSAGITQPRLPARIPALPDFSPEAAKGITGFTPAARGESAPPRCTGHLTRYGLRGIVCCRPLCAFRQEDVAVILRTCTLLVATAGLGMALPLSAQEPIREDANPLTPAQAVAPPTVPPSIMTAPPATVPPGIAALPGSVPPGAGFAVEPQPIYQAPAPGPYDLNRPSMPPYAWPTCAPYNNYSRVAYPTLYPPQAWPFIGPIYPFPKVPLGWRAVKLEWQDGHWWLSRYATPHDWWMLKYW